MALTECILRAVSPRIRQRTFRGFRATARRKAGRLPPELNRTPRQQRMILSSYVLCCGDCKLNYSVGRAPVRREAFLPAAMNRCHDVCVCTVVFDCGSSSELYATRDRCGG